MTVSVTLLRFYCCW